MQSNPMLFGILALAILNGIFSPFAVLTARLVILTLAPGLLIGGGAMVAFLASLLAATGTVILAGVPAALFERATKRHATDARSWAIWLVATAVLSFPAIRTAVALAI
jgi:hypothetical protein